MDAIPPAPPTDAQSSSPATPTPRHPSTEPGHNQDLVIIQRDDDGRAIGGLLHSDTNDEGTMYVHQHNLDLRRPHAGYARQVIAKLITRAVKQNARSILLQTTADLGAIAFWKSCSFVPIAIRPHGPRTSRAVMQFEMRLPCRTQKSDSGPLPAALRPNG